MENKTVFDLAKGLKIPEAKKYYFEKIRPYFPLFLQNTAKGFPVPWLMIIKEGLKLRGINAGVARKPVMGLPDDVLAKLKRILKEYGYI
jgi:4-hydroxy-tetrahydrodipicolinate synthase